MQSGNGTTETKQIQQQIWVNIGNIVPSTKITHKLIAYYIWQTYGKKDQGFRAKSERTLPNMRGQHKKRETKKIIAVSSHVPSQTPTPKSILNRHSETLNALERMKDTVAQSSIVGIPVMVEFERTTCVDKSHNPNTGKSSEGNCQ